jgi:hypothetical protein
MSNPTYDRGMRELIEKGFIAATPSQGMFWLNPSFVWNGDRLAFVKEYSNASSRAKKLEKDNQTFDMFSDPSTDHYPVQTDASKPVQQE